MSTDARRKARRAAQQSLLNDREDDIIIAVEDFFGKRNKLPATVKESVGTQIMALLNGITVTAHADPAALASKPIAALTGSTAPAPTSSAAPTAPATAPTSSTSPVTDDQANLLLAIMRSSGKSDLDDFLHSVSNLLAPLATATQAQQAQRFQLMDSVARGDFKVDDLGLTEMEDKYNKKAAALKVVQDFRDQFPATISPAQIAAMQHIASGAVKLDASGNLVLPADHPVIKERDTLKAFRDEFPQNITPTRLGLMKDAADGKIQLDPNGHLQLPSNHPVAKENRDLKAEKNTLEGFLKDIGDHAKDSTMGDNMVVKTKALKKETRNHLGW